jgi:LPS export ABC transporter protein LptC
MKHACLINLRAKYSVLALTILSILALSCEKKIPIIQKSDLLTLPTLTAKNFNTALKDSGKVQFILSAPIVEQYDKASPPISEFRLGIRVDSYAGHDKPNGRVTSKYAKCTSNNLWELRDSVVVINENNEKLETELLFWNQEKDRIYTDRFVKITSEDEISQGYGFESDSHLSKRRIFKVSAIIYPKDEK